MCLGEIKKFQICTQGLMVECKIETGFRLNLVVNCENDQTTNLTYSLSIIGFSGYSQYVYKTKTGEKYHKENCRYLKYSKAKITL